MSTILLLARADDHVARQERRREKNLFLNGALLSDLTSVGLHAPLADTVMFILARPRWHRSFSEADVVTARFIRFSQSSGLSLAELAAIHMERQQGTISVERGVEITSRQSQRIEDRLAELSAIAQYVREH